VIAIERLIAYALGELEGDEALEVDDHVLSCGACAERLTRLLDLGAGVRALVRGGVAPIFLAPALRDALESAQLITRRYRLRPGEIVPCEVAAHDVYTLIELEANLHGATRVDLVRAGAYRLPDVPIDRARGVVALVQPGERIRQEPTMRIELELIAVEEGTGDRSLGSYTLSHTAYRP
jgi:hypothetical protein